MQSRASDKSRVPIFDAPLAKAAGANSMFNAARARQAEVFGLGIGSGAASASDMRPRRLVHLDVLIYEDGVSVRVYGHEARWAFRLLVSLDGKFHTLGLQVGAGVHERR